MKKIPILIISGLIVLLIFTNPSKNDFDSYISTHINEYAIQSGEDDQTANLISGFSYLLLQSNPGIIHRANYLLFTIYKLDTSLIRSFGGDIEDLVIIGLFNNFVVVNQF
jgi:hypothetical protein